jgi:hypothetical protein
VKEFGASNSNSVVTGLLWLEDQVEQIRDCLPDSRRSATTTPSVPQVRPYLCENDFYNSIKNEAVERARRLQYRTSSGDHRDQAENRLAELPAPWVHYETGGIHPIASCDTRKGSYRFLC